MGIFPLFKKKEIKFNPSNDYFLDILDSNKILISSNHKNKNIAYYYKVPQLANIINYSSKIFANNDLRYYNDKGEQQENEMLTIFQNPHPLYSEGEFWETFSKQFELFNIVLIYKVQGVGSKQPSGLFILPYQLIDIVPKKELKPIDILLAQDINDIISHYEITFKNIKYKIETNDVWMITGSSLKFDNDNYLIPDSIIDSQEAPLKNIVANYEARYSLVENRGQLGLWVNKNKGDYGTVPIEDEEKINIYKQLRSRFGLTKNREIIGITNADLKFESASLPLKDLELEKSIQGDKVTLCDAYNFPILLLNELTGSTYSNLDIADRTLYTKKMIPFWNMVAKSITREFEDSGKFAFYTGDIEVLKKDDKVQAETNQINTNTVIQLNISVINGTMSYENAVNTLVLIADVSEDVAKEVITLNKPTEPTNGQDKDKTYKLVSNKDIIHEKL